MYKGASQSLQARHAVDKPHPSRGYIDGPSDAKDVLPEPESLTVEELRAEQRQLRIELQRMEQELVVAKVARRDVAAIGQRKALHQTRLGAVNKAMNAKDGPSEAWCLGKAIREVAGDVIANQIFARAKELRTVASADRSPEGQDTEERLDAQHESAVPHVDEADAQTQSRNLSSNNSRKV